MWIPPIAKFSWPNCVLLLPVSYWAVNSILRCPHLSNVCNSKLQQCRTVQGRTEIDDSTPKGHQELIGKYILLVPLPPIFPLLTGVYSTFSGEDVTPIPQRQFSLPAVATLYIYSSMLQPLFMFLSERLYFHKKMWTVLKCVMKVIDIYSSPVRKEPEACFKLLMFTGQWHRL